MRYYEASSVIASSPEAVWAGLAVDAGSRTIVRPVRPGAEAPGRDGPLIPMPHAELTHDARNNQIRSIR